jgi:hypothetical protein
MYVDDIALQVACASLEYVRASLLRHLALVGLELQPTQCAVHVRAALGGDAPPEVLAFCAQE